jgi:hypothetical protein
MTWFYAADGKQNGPFTDEQFRSLITAGTVQPTTLVWQAKLTEWIPLSQVPPQLLPPSPAAAATGDSTRPPLAAPLPRCSNCGGEFTPDNLVQIDNALVCPNCKPIVLNRIKEGMNPLSTALNPEDLVYRVSSENRTVDVGRCFTIAWAYYKRNFWPTLGISLLVFVVMMAGGAVPFIGSCISLVITGPLMGGLYLYYLKQIRGEGGTLNDAFAGFTNNFAQLMLASVVTSIIAYLPMVPFIIYLIAHNIGRGPNNFDFGVIDVVLGVVGFIGLFYLFLAWLFVLPLIIDRKLNFWPAMTVSRRVVTMRLGTMILLMLATIGVSLLGLLACLVGILFAIPLVMMAYIVAYEDLLGDRPAQPLPLANG